MTLPPYHNPPQAKRDPSLDHGTMGDDWILKEIRKAEQKWATD